MSTRSALCTRSGSSISSCLFLTCCRFIHSTAARFFARCFGSHLGKSAASKLPASSVLPVASRCLRPHFGGRRSGLAFWRRFFSVALLTVRDMPERSRRRRTRKQRPSLFRSRNCRKKRRYSKARFAPNDSLALPILPRQFSVFLHPGGKLGDQSLFKFRSESDFVDGPGDMDRRSRR